MAIEHPRQGPRIRWRIFSMLVMAATILYFQQRSVTVAAERIMPELSLSQMQIGWLQWAFVLSYGLLQFPGGVFGQRLGARKALAVTGLLAVLACVALPLAPTVLTGTWLFVALFMSQLLLGVAHAPFYPICAGTMERWLPPNRWALAQGIHTFGAQVGAALAPPVLVLLIQGFGWQRALVWSALPALGFIALWYGYVRDTPRQHPAVSMHELNELGEDRALATDTRVSWARVTGILLNRNVLLVTLSYAAMNYTYYLISNWSFLYLIQEQHFAVLEGGWMASLPPLGAALGAGCGGILTEALCRRVGVRWGYRLTPTVALPLAGLLLLGAISVHSPYWAVGCLVLSFACVEITEASYWAATMRIATADSMAATGVLNSGGNLGGIIGIPIVAYLSGHHAWNMAFITGFGFAVVAAALWLRVKPDAGAVG